MKISLTIFLCIVGFSMVAGFLSDATSKKTNEEALYAQAMKRSYILNPWSGWAGGKTECNTQTQESDFDHACRLYGRDALDFLKLRDVVKRASFNDIKEWIHEECCLERCLVEEVVELC
ncbi:uncharacterized protein [Amphiura filiformis]|uniref:uncharacterized protein n=1 Tax=Amphiura filiformis TaxID=82378 RepID=UPI003B216A06